MYFVDNSTDNVLKVCTQTVFEALVQSEKTKKLIQEYRRTGDKKTKEALPAVLWNGVFSSSKHNAYVNQCERFCEAVKKGTRNGEFMDPSGLLMLDFDHVDAPKALLDRILENMEKMGKETEEVLGLAHITPSGKGLRLVVKRERGLTIPEEMMLWGDIACKTVDPSCKDLVRLSFAPMKEEILHYDPIILFTPILDFPEDPKPVKVAKKKSKNEVSRKCERKSLTTDEHEDRVLRKMVQETEAAVAAEIGAPVQGNRHNSVLHTAAHLSHAFDNDPDLMSHYISDYGLPEKEYDDIIKFTAENNNIDFETKKMKEIREKAENEVKETELIEKMDGMSEYLKLFTQYFEFGEQPQMPKILPEPIRIIVDTLPKQSKAYGAIACFAPIGIYLKNTKFRHIRDGYREHCFMVVAVGLSSSGKSDIKRINNFILEPIQQKSDENMARLEAYHREVRKLSKNAKRPEEPKDLTIQIVPDNMTEAAKLLFMRRSAPYYLYLSTSEMERMYKMNNSVKKDFWLDVRNCYDNDVIGAARASADSVQGTAVFRMNWLSQTTPDTFYKELKAVGGIADGALSRLTVVLLVEAEETFDESSMIKDIRDNDTDALALRGYINRLPEVADTDLDCEEARSWHIEQLRRYEEYEQTLGFKYFRCLYRRAITSVFFRAMILWVMNNQVWTREIEDFATWSVEYDLWGKVRIFGDLIKKEFEASQNILAGRTNRSELLNKLPNRFTLQDIMNEKAIELPNAPEDRVRKLSKDLVAQWAHRGHIIYLNDEKTEYEKK